MSKMARRCNLEVVEHNHRARGRLIHGQEKRVLAFRRIWRAVDQNQFGPLQALERFALGGDIKGLDGAEAIPAAREWDDVGKISFSPRDPAFQLLGSAQPIRRVFDTSCRGRMAPERMRGTAGAKLEGAAPCRQKSRDFLQKLAAGGRENPGRNFGGVLIAVIVVLNEALKLTLERSIGRSRIGFSDNPSELLSAFRHASEVSARF